MSAPIRSGLIRPALIPPDTAHRGRAAGVPGTASPGDGVPAPIDAGRGRLGPMRRTPPPIAPEGAGAAPFEGPQDAR